MLAESCNRGLTGAPHTIIVVEVRGADRDFGIERCREAEDRISVLDRGRVGVTAQDRAVAPFRYRPGLRLQPCTSG